MTETYLSLLTKIHNKEMTTDEAVAYAREHVRPTASEYSEDGVRARGNPDNAPNLILWAVGSHFDLDDYYGFFNELHGRKKKRESRSDKQREN